MPSDRAKKKKEKATASKAKSKSGKSSPEGEDEIVDDQGLDAVMRGLNVDDDSHERSCTGVLASHPQSRDVHIESFTLLYHGHELLADTRLELNFGR
jgi:ATP-binding cassette subfamily F protein 2